MEELRLTEVVPQTLRKLCKFSDGSSGWDSRRWDSLAGALVPTNAHTLNKKQTAAVIFAAVNPDKASVKRPKTYQKQQVIEATIRPDAEISPHAEIQIIEIGEEPNPLAAFSTEELLAEQAINLLIDREAK